jgi:small subunit ribosomal protein S21
VLLDEFAERAEESKRIDPGVMAVAPRQAQGVIAHLLNVAQFQVTARLELDGARMALTGSARTVPSEDSVGQRVSPSVAPSDLHLSRAVWCLQLHGVSAGIVGHRSGLATGAVECHIPGPLATPSEAVHCKPLEVQVGDKGIERAIKHLKRKMAAEGILRELKRRRHYMKPSVKRRKKMSEAARRRRKRLKTEERA